MENNFFWLIIILLIGNFLLENGLTLLNYYYYPQKSLPSLIAGFYNQEKYAKSMAYEQAKTRFGILISIVQFVFILLFFVLGGFGWLDRLVQSISDQYLIRNLTFFGILIFSTDLLSLPISYYNTFVLEEKFGFNKTTLRTFILDKLKSWGLILIVGGGILALVVFIYEKSGAHFWWLTWISISVFSLLLTTFYSEWIVPLFNKQLPLESGSLRTAIEDFALKSGFKLDAIFTIDGSKRSTKANAYFSGLGSKKRVVLYDTLIHDLEEQELIAVLAHEIGHYKKKHTLLGLVLSILQTGLMLFILSFFIAKDIAISQSLANTLAQTKDSVEISFYMGIIGFGMIYSPISLLFGLLFNVVSRKNEYAADAFAAKFGLGKNLAMALIKLTVNNLSKVYPHPLYIFFYYSHPSLMQRIRKLHLGWE